VTGDGPSAWRSWRWSHRRTTTRVGWARSTPPWSRGSSRRRCRHANPRRRPSWVGPRGRVTPPGWRRWLRWPAMT